MPKGSEFKQNTVMFSHCPEAIGDILSEHFISDWFVKGFNPLETMRNAMAMVPWCKRTLIVSIYNQQTFVKQIVGNMSQCPTSTLSLILARDLSHSICYKHRLLDWIVLLDPDITDKDWQMISWHFTCLCWWCWDTGSLTHTGARLGNAWEIFMKF